VCVVVVVVAVVFWFVNFFVVKIGSLYVVQADLELLGSSDPLVSASPVTWTTEATSLAISNS
jgi:hypothetical protein